MSRLIKRFVRRCFRTWGVDLYWYSLPRLISVVDPDLVLDVGANTGQYAAELRAAGYRKRIVSFEPLSSTHAKLVKRSAGDDLWCIAPRMALGDREAEAQINIAANSFSSSLMPMAKLHIEAASWTPYTASETVQVRRLDAVAPTYVTKEDRCLLKMDVQGYEWKVLDGARGCMDQIVAIQFETALVQLYEGEALFTSMLDRVAQLGFELWGIAPGFTDHRTGRLLQVDCFCVRTPSKLT